MSSDLNLFKTLGKISGIGGIAFGVLIVIFGGFLRKTIFPNLSTDQAYNILKLLLLLTFAAAVIGVIVWAVNAGMKIPVAVLLVVFAVLVMYMGNERLTNAAETEGKHSKSQLPPNVEATMIPIAIYSGQKSTLGDVVGYRFPFNVKEVDTNDAVSVVQSDWRFTAPISGVYEVDAAFTSSFGLPDDNPKISCQIVVVPKGATLTQGHPEVHSAEPHCEARETLSLHAGDIAYALIYKHSGRVNNVQGKFSARLVSGL
jgi:hypothetical protein